MKDNYSEDSIQIAAFCKALGHPARITILKLLLSKDSCICGDIVKEIPLAQSTVSQHLKELKKAGLIQGNITPPQVKYCINKENWKLAKEALKTFLQ
ncbi:MAG: ArsR family transcriptional regulator [Bacteroidia bacterium]|nr:MAG: ArsR family transcriptional regulator [Bacteroidia bacterium]